MDYLAWRISFQDSEQAARAAFNAWQESSARQEISAMDENVRQLVFEVCNDWLNSGMLMTPAIRDAFMQSTGDRGKYPNPLDALARMALATPNPNSTPKNAG